MNVGDHVVARVGDIEYLAIVQTLDPLTVARCSGRRYTVKWSEPVAVEDVRAPQPIKHAVIPGTPVSPAEIMRRIAALPLEDEDDGQPQPDNEAWRARVAARKARKAAARRIAA